MKDLWQAGREKTVAAAAPLAARMRPRTLDEFIGQTHILGQGRLLRRMLDAGTLTSVILHGPPGTGKTTLAGVIAAQSGKHFEKENAATIGVARVREVIASSQRRLEEGGKGTVLFLDEIHRFSRSQQDVLLADVERGVLTLIGATTENPLFAVNSALVSRSTLFRLEPLTKEEIIRTIQCALRDKERGFGGRDVRVDDGAFDVWSTLSDGDARRALTALEVAVLSQTSAAGPVVIDRAAAEDSIQRKAAVYDHTGDEHYDTISAFIKSVRGSDPDAAVHYLARMLDAGEDPRFIARRLAILASEDIGNADPRAIMVAAAAWELVERIGMPEARITLAQCTTYLAVAAKSNASYTAINEAMSDVREGRTVAIPMYLRDGNTSPVNNMKARAGAASGGNDEEGRALRKKEAGGERYVYSHDVAGAITGQAYMSVDKTYYRPTDSGLEKLIAERLVEIRAMKAACRGRSE